MSTDKYAIIEQFAGREGVKRRAVENFLLTSAHYPLYISASNLQLDARLYGWNRLTVKAIQEGLLELEKFFAAERIVL